MRSILPLVTVFLAVTGTARAGEGLVSPKSGVTKTYESQGWLVFESPSFRVFCRANLADAGRLPESCEALPRQLQNPWVGQAAEKWAPPGDISSHPTPPATLPTQS